MDFLLAQLDVFTYAEWLLVVVSFFTSLLTVVAGIGGGVLLLAVMLSVFPPLVVLPEHVFAFIYKWVITLLAFKLLYESVVLLV